ncbi:MAG: 5'-nucleotidase C-terminal domain-containing protein [Pseudomonadota bacterium]
MKDSANTSSRDGEASDPLSQPSVDAATVPLRILATTDVHMQLLGHDYVNDTPTENNGFAGLATLIKTARAEGTPSILVDNGDMIQGAALGDSLAFGRVTPHHPVIASLNALAYDAIGIGNHDLDYGLVYLQRLAGLSRAPFLSTNLDLEAESAISRATLIPCTLHDSQSGEDFALDVGVLSVLPSHTNIWNRHNLAGKGRVTSPQDALRKAIPQLRAQGADIIVLLAHMGVEETLVDDDVRNVAALPGLDAVIAGHTHRRLPGIDHAGLPNVDVNRGALGSCPAAMPGFNASDLAVLDLKLTRRSDGTWRVADYSAQLRQNAPDVPADPEIAALCAPAHKRARAQLSEPLGQSKRALHNFFSLAMPTLTGDLQAAAQRSIVLEGLAGRAEAELPLLTVVSAHTAGGRGGPDHYLDIPAGTLYRRALAGLAPHDNEVCALRITGAELRAWLEHTAGIYTRLHPDTPDLPLVQMNRAAYHFDTIYGPRYGIDPTQPAGQRIRYLHLDGKPVRDDQAFVLATTHYRAAGGGGGTPFGAERVIFSADTSMQDAMLACLRSGILNDLPMTPPWRFACKTPVKAVLQTSPQAAGYLSDIAHLGPDPQPLDAEGFLPIQLALPALHSATA